MLQTLIDFILHLDVHLAELTAAYGSWVYLILFLIIFAETGLVVTPFLPGDSLLFAVGALASIEGSGLNIGWMWILLIFAAFLGDNVNYQVGFFLGPKVFNQPKSMFLNPAHLHRTKEFYQRYGIRTVLFARFMPILRTFAPFVAGVAQMSLVRYMLFSLLGSFLWMSLFLGAGFYFGNMPQVKSNFHYVILVVIVISFLPVVVTALKNRKATA